MRWVWAGLALVTTVVGAMFWIQNSNRTTQLSLDLGFAAWQLEREVPVLALLGGALLAGLVVGALPSWWRARSLAGRVRELESQQALGQALGRPDGSDPTRGGRDPGAW